MTGVVVLDDDGAGRRLVRHRRGELGEDPLLELLFGIEGVLRRLEPAELELGLECLLGVLLLIEIDRDLHVLPVDRRDLGDGPDDPARVVDLVGDVAPLAVEFFLHAQLDAELAYPFVEVVAGVDVVVLVLLGDTTHVSDDVARQRCVGVHASRVLDDRHPGQILDALLQRDRRALVDVLGDRHR